MTRKPIERRYEETGQYIQVGGSLEPVTRLVPLTAGELLTQALYHLQDAVKSLGQLVPKGDGTFTGDRLYPIDEVRKAVVAHAVDSDDESVFDVANDVVSQLNVVSDYANRWVPPPTEESEDAEVATEATKK